MHVYIPYIYERGRKLYYRRVVPPEMREEIGRKEIKFSVGYTMMLPEMIPALRRLATMTIREVADMARRDRDERPAMEMMTASWDALADTLRRDPPDTMTVERRAILAAIGRLQGAPAAPVVTLDEATKKFLESRRRGGISASGLGDYQSILGEMARVIGGSRDVSTLTVADVAVYREHVQQSNLTIKTKQNKITMSKTFLAWLRSVPLTSATLEDAYAGLRYDRETLVETEPGVSISDDDARTIHDALLPWREPGMGRQRAGSDLRWRYWVYVMCLYHGARPGEMCQLDVADVGDMGGVPCIAISEMDASTGARADDKNVKNCGSERVIPVHPRVIELGLLDYADERRRAGERKLFALGKRHPKNGYTQTVNKFFADAVRALGVEHAYTLRDCRHTWETQIYHTEMTDHERRIAARISGRAVQTPGIAESVTRVQWGHYVTSDYTPPVMLPVLSRIRYPI